MCVNKKNAKFVSSAGIFKNFNKFVNNNRFAFVYLS